MRLKARAGEIFCRRGTVLGSWTNGRPAGLPGAPRDEAGLWFESELVARGCSTSAGGVVEYTLECPYDDIADVARGGRSSRASEDDPVGLIGSGLDPPGRVGRFVRRSFR